MASAQGAVGKRGKSYVKEIPLEVVVCVVGSLAVGTRIGHVLTMEKFDRDSMPAKSALMHAPTACLARCKHTEEGRSLSEWSIPDKSALALEAVNHVAGASGCRSPGSRCSFHIFEVKPPCPWLMEQQKKTQVPLMAASHSDSPWISSIVGCCDHPCVLQSPLSEGARWMLGSVVKVSGFAFGNALRLNDHVPERCEWVDQSWSLPTT